MTVTGLESQDIVAHVHDYSKLVTCVVLSEKLNKVLIEGQGRASAVVNATINKAGLLTGRMVL